MQTVRSLVPDALVLLLVWVRGLLLIRGRICSVIINLIALLSECQLVRLSRDWPERVLLYVALVDHARPMGVLDVLASTGHVIYLVQECSIVLPREEVGSCPALLAHACHMLHRVSVTREATHLLVDVADELWGSSELAQALLFGSTLTELLQSTAAVLLEAVDSFEELLFALAH